MSFSPSPSPSPSPFPLWARPHAGDILLWSPSLETEELQAFSQSGSSLGPACHTAPATTETSSPAPQTPLAEYQNVDWGQQQPLQTPNDPQIFALPDRTVGLAPSPAPPLATAAITPSTTTTTTTNSSVAVRPRDDNDADANAGRSPSKRAKPTPRPTPTPTTTKPPRRPRRTMSPAPTTRRRRARAQTTTTTTSSSSGSGSGSSPTHTQPFTFAAPSTPGNMYESLAASGLRTDRYRPLETGGRKGFRGREAILLG